MQFHSQAVLLFAGCAPPVPRSSWIISQFRSFHHCWLAMILRSRLLFPDR